MTDEQILQELESILEAHGIHVRHEMLEGAPGGMCLVNGLSCMFLDSCARPAELARLCAGALLGSVDIDAMYLRPEVRRYLEETASSGRSV